MNKKNIFEYQYRCPTQGSVNNGLMPSCDFEMVLPEGSHNCPQCGHPLQRVPDGPSVADILRRGQLEEQKQQKKDNNNGE